MLTVRYIERLWDARKYDKLLQELIARRVEAAALDELVHNSNAASAALALVRLDELHSPHAPICGKLIRTLIATQKSDGGWGDVATTALCLRALSLQNGHGLSIAGGMGYLATLQQPAGIWPKLPIRRMPEDALVSAFTILQLGDNDLFRATVRLDAAIAWFDSHQWILDPTAMSLWDHARLRVPATFTTRAAAELSWS